MDEAEAPGAVMTPELYCTDVQRSLDFYTRILGFRVLVERQEDKFFQLEREGVEFMLQEITDTSGPSDDNWNTGPLEKPLGRGMNFQIRVRDVESLRDRVRDANISFFRSLKEVWYPVSGQRETGNYQFLVQDPDGYLLRFYKDLGTRPRQSAGFKSPAP